MTHLVEMQEEQSKFEAAGLKLYAISYDEQDALADFAKSHDITYTMLSDSDSRVIREYGILNTGVGEHEAPFYGMAYPGTYITDREGRIVAKFFNRHIAMRESADTFIDSALGKLFVNEAEHQTTGGDEDISVEVLFYGGRSFKHGLLRKLIVRFKLREGLHIYGEPVPDGMVATSVEIEGPEGFHTGEPILPPTEPLRMEALNTTLHVWSGEVDIVVPMWVNDPLAPLISNEASQSEVELTITVRYQACDDTACHIPRTETFYLTLPIESASTPRLSIFRGNNRTTKMQSTRHLKKMIFRSIKRRPTKTLHILRYLWHQVRSMRK